MNKLKKNNVVTFPASLTEGEREIEALVFAAAEPLDVDTIESKISKKVNVLNTLKKIQETYSNRGINLVCISKKWSFRTAQKNKLFNFNINCCRKYDRIIFKSC